MLLLNEIKPDLSIYYYSSFLLQELKSTDQPNDIISLYSKMKRMYSISFKMFAYCLDWLYLIDAAQVNEKGEVTLCI